MVPGRLTAINGEPAKEHASKESQGERALQRDLSLTWAADLPSGNRLVAGQWWDQAPAGDLPGVSVEAKLAGNLGLQLGDRLSFSVGGISRDVRITSLREVDWDNFQPNFFMIFAPGSLADLPATYLTSFYLPPQHDRELVELARAFPAVTLLEVEAILAQLRSILAQVTVAVEFVLLFVLAAGLAVLFAGLQSTLDERIRQARCCGPWAPSAACCSGLAAPSSPLLGAAAGLLAALGCELVSALLYTLAFDLQWHPHPWLLLLPPLGALLVGGAGVIGTRRALNASPLQVLREA